MGRTALGGFESLYFLSRFGDFVKAQSAARTLPQRWVSLNKQHQSSIGF